jgi:hypothetical protein
MYGPILARLSELSNLGYYDIIATQLYFTVATCLIWSVAIVCMHHSSDGRL